MDRRKDILRDDELHYRANSDMAKRSFTGCFIYLLIWFVVVFPNRFYETSPEIFYLFTGAFVFFAVFRIFLILGFDRIYRRSKRLWQLLFYAAVWLPSLTWGLLCATALIHPSFEPLYLVILISTAGLTGGGVAALVPDRVLTIGLISGFLLPSLMILLSSASFNISLSFVFCAYWLGMYSVTKIQHKEYWQGLHATYLLQLHANELQQKNTLDGLTGLKNRSYFDECLQKEFNKSTRFKGTLSLLLIDLDRFKGINDKFGHLAGDECLRQLSKSLQAIVKRETDVVARYGGEEFAVILPGMQKEETLAMANSIREAVEERLIQHNGQEIAITVSIGVACMTPVYGQKAEEIVAIADKALYTAKNNGRNRVVA